MAGVYPEIWLSRFRENLAKGGNADFLNGIPEINATVNTINKGTLSEKNEIHVPTSDFEVDVLLNNTTYPIPVQQWDDDSITIILDKFQSKVVTVTDDQKIGSSYEMIDQVQRTMVNAMMKTKFQKAIHALAPAEDTAKTPVLKATGGSAGLTDATGRKRLTYEDLVAFKARCKDFDNIRLVLNDDHWNDLLLDRARFGDRLVDYRMGTPMPYVLGMEITHYRGEMPIFKENEKKKAYGAVKAGLNTYASVAFDTSAVAVKSGKTFQYFLDAKNNPRTQSNELAYRNYFIAVPYRNEKIGAII